MIFWDHAQKEWSWLCYGEVSASECKGRVTSHQLVWRNIPAQLIPVIFSRNIFNYEKGSALAPVLNRVKALLGGKIFLIFYQPRRVKRLFHFSWSVINNPSPPPPPSPSPLTNLWTAEKRNQSGLITFRRANWLIARPFMLFMRLNKG